MTPVVLCLGAGRATTQPMPFVDLGVRVDPGNPHALREHLSSLLELGYAAVALDTKVDACDRNARPVLIAGLIPLDDDVLRAVAKDADSNNNAVTELVVLRRVTVSFGEPGDLATFLAANDDLVRRYDLFALHPTSERSFASSVANRRCDILALTLGGRSAFRLRANSLKSASASGMSVEISYNPALLDLGSRRNFFANGVSVARAVGENAGGGMRGMGGGDSDDDSDDLTRKVVPMPGTSNNSSNTPNSNASKKKNSGGIILTSGSRQAVELRAPRDVCNLASLIGMKDENARAALSVRPIKVVRNARRKRQDERFAAGDK